MKPALTFGASRFLFIGVALAIAGSASALVACGLAINGEAAIFDASDGGDAAIDAASFDAGALDGGAPGDATSPRAAVDIAVGSGHACARLGSGSVVCWGENASGQLGRGNGSDAASAAPAAVISLPTSVAVRAGGVLTGTGANDAYGFTCAVTTDGRVACWGSDAIGQLGRGDDAGSPDNAAHPAPVFVRGLDRARDVAAGGAHACALDDGAGLVCWGNNGQAELGRDAGALDPTARAIATVTAAPPVAIAAGPYHSCVLESGSGVECWGTGANGQLGRTLDAGVSVDPTPAPVPGVHATKVAVGVAHTCALLTGGSIACWGYDGHGELGRGSTSNAEPVPADVSLSANALAVDVCAGAYHSCAVLSEGSVECWGYNGYGQLGVGVVDDAGAVAPSYSPIPLRANVTGARRVACGGYSTCAILDDGSVACWGSNAFGQIGAPLVDGGDPWPHPNPVNVAMP